MMQDGHWLVQLACRARLPRRLGLCHIRRRGRRWGGGGGARRPLPPPKRTGTTSDTESADGSSARSPTMTSSWRDAGFSSKNVWIRPNQPVTELTRVTRMGPQPMGPKPDLDAASPAQLAEWKLAELIDRLEQQVRDAVFGRTTAHIGEERVLKQTFTRFDKDASGNVDCEEFAHALEYLGLHTAGEGLPGEGGLPPGVVQGLFARYDADHSGTIDYDEFSGALLRSATMTKMT